MGGFSEDNYKILVTKKYIIPFDSGVIVIRHWKLNNYIRPDRYTETLYQEEKAQLAMINGTYHYHMRCSIMNDLLQEYQILYYKITRKLLNYANDNGVSIGDLNMQVAFLIKELKTGYSAVWKILCTASDVKTAFDAVMCQYECPADVSASARSKRAGFGQKYYDMFVNAEVTADKSVQELAQEVLENKWGTGQDRKERLTAAGYDYTVVQKRVNELLDKSSESVENHVETVETPEKETIQVTAVKDGKNFSGVLTASETISEQEDRK